MDYTGLGVLTSVKSTSSTDRKRALGHYLPSECHGKILLPMNTLPKTQGVHLLVWVIFGSEAEIESLFEVSLYKIDYLYFC